MTVIVALYGSVRSLVLVISVRGYENRSHHRKGTEGGGYHVAHDIAVVVLAGPDKAALCFHDAGNGVVDQSVEVGNACFCKFLFVLCIEDLLEDILEAVIILLGNRILACKPQILFRGQCVLETASRKAFYGVIQIVHALNDTGAGEVVDQLSCLGAVLSRINQLCFSRSRNAHFCIFIDISVCMTGNRDRFFPVAHARLDAFYDNRGTENGSVEHGTDRSVRALPHFFQIVLGHTRCIRRNGGTFDCYTVFLGSVCGIYGYLIVRLVSVFQSQIVIFRFQVNKREKQLIFDHFPENSGHLISIHLYQRCRHLNFFHNTSPLSDI